MEKRNANFDLMKIISMFMIIGGHLLLHGKILDNTTGTLNIFFTFLMYIFIVHVNSFILTTGYFQYNKEFKLSKIISLNNAMWFYKVIIMIILLGLGITTLTKPEIIKTLLPINYNDYWFIKCYLLLYISTPLLNIIIKNTNKEQHRLIIIIMFIIFSIFSTLTHQEVININNGYSIENFIFLYFIGSYISKYKVLNKIKNITKTRIILISLFILIPIIQTIYNILITNNITDINLLSQLKNSSLGYSNPLIIIQSIIYFLLFKTLTINNKYITKISSLVLGIYLIHENNLIRKILYVNILKLPITTIYSYNIIYKFIIYIILIFIICSIIEYIRQLLFKFIYNREISENMRKEIKSLFKKININW